MYVKVERYFEMESKTLFAEIVNKYYERTFAHQFESDKDHLAPTAGIVHPLTKRELEVGYHHIVGGMNAREIAKMLVAHQKTVEQHLTHFRYKCGTTGSWRYRMIAEYWYRAGRLGMEPPD